MSKVGKKYIIELDEHFEQNGNHGEKDYKNDLFRVKGFHSLVLDRHALNKLEEYKGVELNHNGYEIGAKKAWETAKAIVEMDDKTGFAIFGTDRRSVFQNMTADEAWDAIADHESEEIVYLENEHIRFALNDGEVVEAMHVRYENDGCIYCLVDCLKKEYPMKRDGDCDSYENSDLRAALNGEILDRFPLVLRNQMLPFENGDLLRIPTEMEIFGENKYGVKETGVSQWEPMKLRRNRIAFQGDNGDFEWYWLQNKRDVASSAYFAYVDSNGGADYYNASLDNGVRPAFKIRNL